MVEVAGILHPNSDVWGLGGMSWLPTHGWHEAQIPGVSKLAVVGGHGNPALGKSMEVEKACRCGSWGWKPSRVWKLPEFS